MTDREMEARLAAALERTAPDDVEAVLARCGAQTGAVVPLPGQGGGQSGKQKKRWVPLAVAACLVLAVAGGGAGYVHQLNQAVASIVCLDVNPSVELTVNRKETVLSATPANADAVAILDGMDLTGAKVDVAMNAIVGAMLTNGYVDELANSILITVEDDDAQRGAALQQALTAQADAILASYQVNGAILSQTIQNSAQLQQLSQEYGISAGKAALIQTIIDGSHGTKTFESLVGLSINELNLLYSTGDSVRQALCADFAGQLQALGIACTLEGVGWDTAYDRALSEPLIWGWGAHTPMELYNLYHTVGDSGSALYSPYSNAAVDSYMDQALASTDLNASYELWQKAQWDGTTGVTQQGDVPWVWLVNVDHLYWVRDGLQIAEQKIHPHGHGWSIVNNVDQWSW